MIIKSADPRGPDIRKLKALLLRQDIKPTVRRKIQNEIDSIRAGERCEQEAAYMIDFHHRTARNWMVIHDLRIKSNGNSAQIDHLLINWLLEFWVCESKYFREGVSINEAGEWECISNGRRIGIPSPIEQNKRHIAVLKSALSEGRIPLPKRMGLPLRPTFKNVVLVSDGARIERPLARVPGLNAIVKPDQLRSKIETDIEKGNPLVLLKLIPPKKIESIARELASLHEPAQLNWSAKFGLPAKPPLKSTVISRSTCQRCGKTITKKVLEFCGIHIDRFAGGAYCTHCQRNFPYR